MDEVGSVEFLSLEPCNPKKPPFIFPLQAQTFTFNAGANYRQSIVDNASCICGLGAASTSFYQLAGCHISGSPVTKLPLINIQGNLTAMFVM